MLSFTFELFLLKYRSDTSKIFLILRKGFSKAVVCEKVVFEKVVFEKVVFEGVVFEEVVFEKVVFEKVVLRKVTSEKEKNQTKFVDLYDKNSCRLFNMIEIINKINIFPSLEAHLNK